MERKRVISGRLFSAPEIGAHLSASTHQSSICATTYVVVALESRQRQLVFVGAGAGVVVVVIIIPTLAELLLALTWLI